MILSLNPWPWQPGAFHHLFHEVLPTLCIFLISGGFNRFEKDGCLIMSNLHITGLNTSVKPPTRDDVDCLLVNSIQKPSRCLVQQPRLIWLRSTSFHHGVRVQQPTAPIVTEEHSTCPGTAGLFSPLIQMKRKENCTGKKHITLPKEEKHGGNFSGRVKAWPRA